MSQKEEPKKPEVQVVESKSLNITTKELQDLIAMASVSSAQAIVAAMGLSKPTEADAAKKVEQESQCRECGQRVKACKSQHRMAMLYPSNSRHAKWFQGIKINGVTYRSDRPGQTIAVPKESNVEHMLNLWEESENNLQIGREAQHNSGVLSGTKGKGGFSPAIGAWR